MTPRVTLRAGVLALVATTGCRHFYVADGSVLDAAEAGDVVGPADSAMDAMDGGDAATGSDGGDAPDASMPSGFRVLFPISGMTVGSTNTNVRFVAPADFETALLGGEICSPDLAHCGIGTPDMALVRPRALPGVYEFVGPHLAAGTVYFRVGRLVQPDAGTMMSGPAHDTAFSDVSPWVEFRAIAPIGSSPAIAGDQHWGMFPDFDRDGNMDVTVGGLSTTVDPMSMMMDHDMGAAYVYSGADLAMGTTSRPVTLAPPLSSGSRFGQSLRSAGDVNGDGYTDLVVGRPYGGGGGAIYLYLGGQRFFSVRQTPTVIQATDVAPVLRSNQLGTSVDSAGDVNGDGYADVIAGAPNATAGGEAIVFLGGPDGISPARVIRIADAHPGFGQTVAGVGDLNHDPFSEVAIGAPDSSSVTIVQGAATPTATARTTLDGGVGTGFGTAIASIGDVDRDGFADLAVGAVRTDGTGSLLVFLGMTPSGDGSPAFMGGTTPILPGFLGTLNGFAQWISGGGDVDNDGHPDFLVGSRNGAVVLYQDLSGSLIGTNLHDTSTGSTPSPTLIGSATVDVDNDGFTDPIWGDVMSAIGSTRNVFVNWGGTGFPTLSPARTALTLNVTGDTGFGQALAFARVHRAFVPWR